LIIERRWQAEGASQWIAAADGSFGSFSTESRLPFDVCFSPRATYLLRGNEMTRRAKIRSRASRFAVSQKSSCATHWEYSLPAGKDEG
jgi:hypothetical protein